jgi:hypothetical protein
MSTLAEAEIEQLVSLLENQPAIRELVDSAFSRLGRGQQIQRLRSRCSADMFVCLKNIFASDELDAILLKEYAALHEDLQGIYRLVAALEASGTKVHRQLVLRLLRIQSDSINGILTSLDGLVEEFAINENEGMYGWSTRHEVIAQTIARYKFADQDKLYELLSDVVDGLNPSIWTELRTIRDICNRDFGIGHLSDNTRQLELLEKLIRIAPGERVPRHRIIGKYLDLGKLDDAAQAIRQAEEDVGFDSIVSRYRIRLLIQRAQATTGIMLEDRRAILLEAERAALAGLSRLTTDKYSYIAYGDVGEAYAELTRDVSMLDSALVRMREAIGHILDPQLDEALSRFERVRRRLPGG